MYNSKEKIQVQAEICRLCQYWHSLNTTLLMLVFAASTVSTKAKILI